MISRIFTSSMIACSLLFLAACDPAGSVEEWATNTSRLRVAAENQISNLPYRKGQHTTFKSYFSTLNEMALGMKKDEDISEGLNEVVEKGNIADLCRKTFMQKSVWDQLLQNCSKNRFFICAEEVRAYPDLVRAFRGALNSDNRKKFDKTDSCAGAL